MTANQIKATSASGTRVINFNGGTLKSGASALASTFLGANVATTANVRNGGAIIDTNGNSVTIGQALVHSTIDGDNAIDGGPYQAGRGHVDPLGRKHLHGSHDRQHRHPPCHGLARQHRRQHCQRHHARRHRLHRGLGHSLQRRHHRPGLTGATGTLNVGSLTLGGGSVVNQEFGGLNDLITVTNAGGLTINSGAGYNLYAVGTTTPYTTNGLYNLIGYSGALNGSASNLSVLNGQAGKTYTFSANGSFVTLTINTSGVVVNNWNVDADGNWTTGANWSQGVAPNGTAAFASFGSAITARAR